VSASRRVCWVREVAALYHSTQQQFGKSPLYTTHRAGLRSLPLYSACALPR
jgi:hypothetical protein